MMQTKENQQLNVVKENILQPQMVNKSIHTVKGLQPSKSYTSTVIVPQVKSTGLQVSKHSLNVINPNVAQNQLIKPATNQTLTKSSCLQVIKQTTNVTTNANVGQKAQTNDVTNKTTNVNRGKMNGQKENSGLDARQSLKAIKQNEIIDGKIKKVVAVKQNSVGKGANRKAKRSNENLTNKQRKVSHTTTTNNKTTTTTTTTAQAPLAKSSECDFVIFCDENDELAIKAVEKENAKESKPEEIAKVEKKKGLVPRNANQQVQQPNVQVNLKATVDQIEAQTKNVQQLVTESSSGAQSVTTVSTSTATNCTTQESATIAKVRQTLANIQTNFQSAKANIESIKQAVVPINDLTLNETTLDEITLNEQSTIENKENDPTFMSIDVSRLDEDMDVQSLQPQQDKYKDVSGDMCCQEFSNEIYLYMLERELKFLPDPTYMSKQPEINSKMRAMLVDWLIDVGIEYELENETVFLTISYIDQFLSSLTISLQDFQLLGTAALFIASKYEEIYPPELKDFIFVTDDAYTKLQMLSMEKVILKSLKFCVSPPTIIYFLRYFLTKFSLPLYVQYFAEYLCFLSLLHTEPFLSYSPSDTAISSIILALHTYAVTDVIDLDEFKQLTRIHFCKDDEGKLSDAKAILIRQSCVNAMYKLQKTAAEDAQQAVYTKYSSEKYLSVALVDISEEVPLVENFFD